jgi:Ca-activated chloride channel family protein
MKPVRPWPCFSILLALALTDSSAVIAAEPTRAKERAAPVLMATIDDTPHPLSIERAEIRVTIRGFLAETTTTLTFHNPHDRALEGDLTFPLPDGAALSGFALDVGGQMVDGVIVEKAAARIAFERETRKGVDPGLVESVQGNNFRTRVWPIPARGTRAVRVQYVNELVIDGDDALYPLLLSFPNAPPELFVHIEVASGDAVPAVRSGPGTLHFERWEDRFVAEGSFHGLPPSSDLLIALPQTNREHAMVERADDGSVYFAVTDFPAAPEASPTVRSNRVALFWDASLSRALVDHRRERALVEQWARRIGSVEVDVIPFRNAPDAPHRFTVRAGDASALLQFLDGLAYDGGTCLESLRLTKRYDYGLLISDGLVNLGARTLAVLDAPLYAVSDNAAADTALLANVAQKSGGAHLDLRRQQEADAAARVGAPVFSFVSADYDGKAIGDLEPAGRQAVTGRFMATGRLLADEAHLTLHYGIGAASFSRRFVLRRGDAVAGRLVARAWAQRRVNALSLAPEQNHDELLRLGRAFGIVTPGASLLVLESVDQYLAYRVEPPASLPEMRAEYERRVGDEEKEKPAQTKIDRVLEQWKRRVAWWEKPAPTVIPTVSPTPTQLRATPIARVATSAAHGLATLSGVVSDEGGGMIARCAIVATNEDTGATHSTETCADGRYTIAALPPGPYRLRAEAAGFTTGMIHLSLRADEGARIDVVLRAGSVAEQITVEADASLAARTTAAEINEVATLPLNGHNFLQMALLLPGASAPAANGRESVVVAAVEPWNPDTPYLAKLKDAGAAGDYATFLGLRTEYGRAPSFYVDCAEHFLTSGRRDLGLRVLTDVLELGLEEPVLIRIVAHRLVQIGELDSATSLFQHVLRLRPEEPQSLRDLALALEARGDARRAAGDGRRAGEDYERAMELLNRVIEGEWDQRFPEIETIALEEANRIAAVVQGDSSLRSPRIPLDTRLRKLLHVDVRIVLTWDSDMADMDLWVTEPSGEKCFYSHPQTRNGAMISSDFTGGYGPEEYLLRHAAPGTYTVEANYYGSREVLLAGPTTLHATLITNFGRPSEKRQSITLRLKEAQEVFKVGTVTVR